ncbi:hypothetical protein [Bradyrhizobium sp. LeoA1S1]
MFRLFFGIVAGGHGLALAIDSALAGHTAMAVLFTAMTILLLGYGWFELKAQTATKAQTDILRANIDTLIQMNAKRSGESAVFVQALLDAREVLQDKSPQAAIEIIDDALAEFHEPATIVRFCIDWLTDVVHNANKHWWTDPATGEDLRNARFIVPTKLMLTVGEIAEAMEAHRKNLADDKLPNYPGLTVELADALFRIFDLAGAQRLAVGAAAADKLRFNEVRPDHKAEARLKAVNGKHY